MITIGQLAAYAGHVETVEVPGMHVVMVGEGESKSWTYPLKDIGVEYFSPSFTWTRDSKSVAFSTLDRHQASLAVHLWDPDSGADRKVVEEKDPYWINAIDAPYFLKDGRHFLWLSERDGWMHLYTIDAAADRSRQAFLFRGLHGEHDDGGRALTAEQIRDVPLGAIGERHQLLRAHVCIAVEHDVLPVVAPAMRPEV